jgi:hypothetical protein
MPLDKSTLVSGRPRSRHTRKYPFGFAMLKSLIKSWKFQALKTKYQTNLNEQNSKSKTNKTAIKQ